MPERCCDRILVVLRQALAALDPAAGLEVDAGMALEVVEVPLLAAQEERDAVVGAGDDQGDVPRRQAHQAVAAQGIAQQHGVVLRLVHRGQHFLQPGRHAGLADVVQSLGQELDVDLVDRPGHRGAQLAVEDFAGNQFQAHGVSWSATLRFSNLPSSPLSPRVGDRQRRGEHLTLTIMRSAAGVVEVKKWAKAGGHGRWRGLGRARRNACIRWQTVPRRPHANRQALC